MAKIGSKTIIFILAAAALILVCCSVFSAAKSFAWSPHPGYAYWDPNEDHNYTITEDSLINLSLSDASADPDKDGLCNADELLYGTDSYNPDSDGDGMPDGWEINPSGWFSRDKLNPLDPSDADNDSDGDGWTNLREFQQYYNPEICVDNAGVTHVIYAPTDPFDTDTDGDGMVDSVDPLPHIYQRPYQPPPPEDDIIFWVDTDHPRFWRSTAYDEYVGSSSNSSWAWRSNPSYVREYKIGDEITLEVAQNKLQYGTENTAKISINKTFNDMYAPTALHTTSVSNMTPYVKLLNDSFGSFQIVSGYKINSYDFAATDFNFTGTDLLASATVPSEGECPEYYQLPDGYETKYPKVKELALNITNGANSSYEKMERIMKYISDACNATGNDTNNTAIPEGEDPVNYSLFENPSHLPYMTTTTFVVLARCSGIPSRVASGYWQGEKLPNGTYEVHKSDATTWPEVLFNELGWMELHFGPSSSENQTKQPANVQIRINITDFPKKIDDVHPFYVNGTVEYRLNDTSNWTAAPNATVNIFLNETLNDTLNATIKHWNGSAAGAGLTDENGTFNITCLTPSDVPEGMVNITGNVGSAWSNDTYLSEYRRVQMRINITKFPGSIDNRNNFSVNGTVQYRMNETSNWTFLSNATAGIFVNATGGSGVLAGTGTTDGNGTFNVTCTAPSGVPGGVVNITANVGVTWSNATCFANYSRNTLLYLFLPVLDDEGKTVTDAATGLPLLNLSAQNSTSPVFLGVLFADDGDGNLSTNDLPMMNKTIDIYLDGKHIKSNNTDSGGGLRVAIPITGHAGMMHNLTVKFAGDKFNASSNFPYLIAVTHPFSAVLNVSGSVSVGETLKIAGTIKDDDGYPLNYTTNTSSMGITVFFDDKPYVVNVSGDGSFSVDYFVPNSTTPKDHTILVDCPDMKEKIGNGVIYYYSHTVFSKQIKVQRKTQIEIPPQTVYAKAVSGRDYTGKRTYKDNFAAIYGTIRDNMNSPVTNGTTGQIIKENASTELGDLIRGFWGNNESGLKEIPVAHNITINSTGFFSVAYPLPQNQSVGLVNLTMSFEGADYYMPCETTVQYTVRAYTDIEMKSKSIHRDENITINGTLYDSGGAPIAGAGITLLWNGEYIGSAATDVNGMFSMDYHVARNQSLGCVNVTAATAFGGASFYDASSMTIPYYVISNTTLELFPKDEVMKGGVVICGRVIDDQGTPIDNGTVRWYWNWPSNAPMGDVLTDNAGRFSLLNKDANVSLGIAVVCANFTGEYVYAYKVPDRDEYIYSGHKLDSNDTGLAYSYEDLTYIGREFVRVPSQNVTDYVVWADTIAYIDAMGKLIRGEQVNITGAVYENLGEGRIEAIRDQKVTLVFDINEDGKINSTETQTVLVKTNGRFGFPMKLPNYTALKEHDIKIIFNGSDTDYLKPSNATLSAEVSANTKLAFITSEIREINASLNYVCGLLLTNDNGEPVGNATLRVYSGANNLNFSLNVTTDSTGFAFFNESVGNLTSRNYLVSADYGGSAQLHLLQKDETSKVPYTVPAKIQPGPNYALICGAVGAACGASAAVGYWITWRRKKYVQWASQIFMQLPKEAIAKNEHIAAIYKAYQKLNRQVAAHGYARQDTQTFREFERVVRANLPLDAVSLNNFLTVLEKARYSSHDVGFGEHDIAIRSFGVLEKNIGDYQKSLLEMEKQRKEAKLKEDAKRRVQKDGTK